MSKNILMTVQKDLGNSPVIFEPQNTEQGIMNVEVLKN
jgi:hypothetical protein